MLEVTYEKKFLKELANVPSDLRGEIETFVFETLPSAASLGDLNKFEKLSG